MHEATRKGKRNRWSREAAGLRRGSGDRPKPPWKSSAREESCYLGKPRVAAGLLLLFSSFLCPVPGLGCARTPAVATRTSGTLWDTRAAAELGAQRRKFSPWPYSRGSLVTPVCPGNQLLWLSLPSPWGRGCPAQSRALRGDQG